MAADHILSADVSLSDGSKATFSEIKIEELPQRINYAPLLMAEIYRTISIIRNEYSEAIKQNWPDTWRRASGYNLNYLIPWSPSHPPQWFDYSLEWTKNPCLDNLPYPPIQQGCINQAPLLAGSEGTLAIMHNIKLRLVPKTQKVVLGVISYQTLQNACDEVPKIMDRNPSAIELIPRSLIQLARSVPAYAQQVAFVKQVSKNGTDPAALLVIQFSGNDYDPLREISEYGS